MADDKKPAPAASPAFPSIWELVIGALVLALLLPAALSVFNSVGGTSVMSGVFSQVLSFVKILSTLVVMIASGIGIYAYLRINDLVAEENKKLGLLLNWSSERKQKNVRWEKVEEYMVSANASDWKIAILEADNILDEIVERMGYEGETLGERMKNIEASDFPYLDEAWQVHKLRNAIAHKGTDYPLVKSEAQQAVDAYHRIFKELGYL